MIKNNIFKSMILFLILAISTIAFATDVKDWINNFNNGVKTMDKAMDMKKDLIKMEELLLEAVNYFQKSVDVYPNSLVADEAHFLMAKCYMSLPFNKTANMKKAVQQYEIIIEYIPLSKYVDKAKEMIEKIKSDEKTKLNNQNSEDKTKLPSDKSLENETKYLSTK
jgi:outer membrane protein assembly factor BamD (BamD/ComL family)